MKLTATNSITLKNVKKSNYWDLISFIIWNHYSEKHYQDDKNIEITEQWYGKCESGGFYSDQWNNKNFERNGYTRTLKSIQIKFSRTDYITYINISAENGNISAFGLYTDKKNTKSINFSIKALNLKIVNWMLQNNFIKLQK